MLVGLAILLVPMGSGQLMGDGEFSVGGSRNFQEKSMLNAGRALQFCWCQWEVGSGWWMGGP